MFGFHRECIYQLPSFITVEVTAVCVIVRIVLRNFKKHTLSKIQNLES